MIKAVFDTNIFVSSLYWKKGNPHRVFQLALDKKIQLFVSMEIINELEKVLLRDFSEIPEIIEREKNLIMEFSEMIYSTTRITMHSIDEDDCKILECAVACKADYIVAGDKKLLALKEFCGIKIVPPKEFI